MKKNKLKTYAGMAILATSLAFNGCNQNSDFEDDTVVLNSNISYESPSDNSISSNEVIVEEDKYATERAYAEGFYGKEYVDFFYSDEFRNVSDITIFRNGENGLYELLCENYDEGFSCTIYSTDTLINYFISLTDCKTLNIANINDANILTDLDEFSNIEELYILDVPVRNLNWIYNLPNLKSLRIINCENFSDISQISDVPLIENIWISGTKLSDISALNDLPNLTVANLSCNEITDLSSLVNTNLSVIILSYNNITSPDKLSPFIENGLLDEDEVQGIIYSSTNHDSIFGGDDLEDRAYYMVIEYFDSKEEYHFRIYDENDLMIGEGLLGDELAINNITSILSNCKEVIFSNIKNDDILGWVANPEQYEILHIQCSDLETINSLNYFKNIRKLIILNCYNLSNIESLYSGIPLDLDKLQSLTIRNTNLSDLKQLEYMPNLERINIQNNRNLTNFDFLLTYDNLKIVNVYNISYNPNIDLTPFETLSNNGVSVNGINVPSTKARRYTPQN